MTCNYTVVSHKDFCGHIWNERYVKTISIRICPKHALNWKYGTIIVIIFTTIRNYYLALFIVVNDMLRTI